MLPETAFKYGAEVDTSDDFVNRLWAFNTVCASRLKHLGRIVRVEVRPCETIRVTWLFNDGTKATWSTSGFLPSSYNKLRDESGEILKKTLAQHPRVSQATRRDVMYSHQPPHGVLHRIDFDGWQFGWRGAHNATGYVKGVLAHATGTPGRAWYEMAYTNGEPAADLRALQLRSERPELMQALDDALAQHRLQLELWPEEYTPPPQPKPRKAPEQVAQDAQQVGGEETAKKARKLRRWKGRIDEKYACNWVDAGLLQYNDENHNDEATEWSVHLPTDAHPKANWINVRLMCPKGAMHKGSYHLGYSTKDCRLSHTKDAGLLVNSRPGLHVKLLELLKEVRKNDNI